MPGETAGAEASHASHPLLKLQRSIGNRAVQRLLAQREQAADLQRAPNAKATTPAGFVVIDLASVGTVKGGSKHAGHEGKVEFASVSWGKPEMGAGVGRGGRGDSEEGKRVTLTITRVMDDASPILARAAAIGDAIKSATFEMVKADKDGKLATHASIQFKGGYITTLQVGGGDPPMETITFELSGGEFQVPPSREQPRVSGDL
jgi:type VI secretion system secreted protein Hcp